MLPDQIDDLQQERKGNMRTRYMIEATAFVLGLVGLGYAVIRNISEQIEKVETEVRTRVENLDRVAQDRYQKTIQQMESEHEKLETRIESEHEKLETRIESEHEKLETRIESEHEKLDGKIEKRLTDLKTTMDIYRSEMNSNRGK